MEPNRLHRSKRSRVNLRIGCDVIRVSNPLHLAEGHYVVGISLSVKPVIIRNQGAAHGMTILLSVDVFDSPLLAPTATDKARPAQGRILAEIKSDKGGIIGAIGAVDDINSIAQAVIPGDFHMVSKGQVGNIVCALILCEILKQSLVVGLTSDDFAGCIGCGTGPGKNDLVKRLRRADALA